MSVRPSALVPLGLLVLLSGCGGGGGGGGDGPPPSSKQVSEQTIATTGASGEYARVDLVDGGNPDSDAAVDVAKRAFFDKLVTRSGADLDGSVADASGDGVPDTGFETYATGLTDGTKSSLIFGANNLYDLFQTRTGPPEAVLVDSPPDGFLDTFLGFDGGDLDGDFAGGDPTGDGGPGLHSNVPGSPWPTLPVLPAFMGTGRGSQPGDQHQFIQVVFEKAVDPTSVFDLLAVGNSYLGDSALGATDNVFLEARWVQRPDGDTVNAVDQTFQHRHVPVVAILGGVAALPTAPGLATHATVDPALSNLPAGCLPRVMSPKATADIRSRNRRGPWLSSMASTRSCWPPLTISPD